MAGMRFVWMSFYRVLFRSVMAWLGVHYNSNTHERSWLLLMFIMC